MNGNQNKQTISICLRDRMLQYGHKVPLDRAREDP